MTGSGTPAWIIHDAQVCRRSWLCRRRHNHDYADLCVMPTWVRLPLWGRESRLIGSA
jgi:hypothetical protein